MGVVVNGSCSPINVGFSGADEIGVCETPVVETLGVLSLLLTGDVTGTGCPPVVQAFSVQFSFSFSKLVSFSAELLRRGGAKTLDSTQTHLQSDCLCSLNLTVCNILVAVIALFVPSQRPSTD